MGALRYIVPLWIGIFLYVVLSFISGEKGLSAYRQLEAERDREIVNIEALKQTKQNLEYSKNALLFDRDTITVLAREQGLVSPGERLARIVTMGIQQRPASSPGQIVNPVPPLYTSDRFIKIFSFCAAFTVLICMVIYDVLRFLNNDR